MLIHRLVFDWAEFNVNVYSVTDYYYISKKSNTFLA